MIEFNSVSKIYRRKDKLSQALENISFVVQKGDIYGIIGLSGAGKSTLIRALPKLIDISSGEILFHGNDIAKMPPSDLRKVRQKIGMIFQHFNLLSSRTVAGNISYPLEVAGASKEKQEARVEELLALVGLKEKKDTYPSQLSGGEKQRVGIARALANDPEVLLCDEGTSALDPKTTRDILTLLKDIHARLGITILLITHEMDVVKQICNKVAVIDRGKIVEQGLVTLIFSEPQHPLTQHFLQGAAHTLPPEFFKPLSSNCKLLRLHFKGVAAGEPIISALIKRFNIDANILLGWIDRIPTLTLGTLVIEFSGEEKNIRNALDYLLEKGVRYEVLEA